MSEEIKKDNPLEDAAEETAAVANAAEECLWANLFDFLSLSLSKSNECL